MGFPVVPRKPEGFSAIDLCFWPSLTWLDNCLRTHRCCYGIHSYNAVQLGWKVGVTFTSWCISPEILQLVLAGNLISISRNGMMIPGNFPKGLVIFHSNPCTYQPWEADATRVDIKSQPHGTLGVGTHELLRNWIPFNPSFETQDRTPTWIWHTTNTETWFPRDC